MIQNVSLAQRYTIALQNSIAADQAESELTAAINVLTAISTNPVLSEALTSPIMPKEDKHKILENLLSKTNGSKTLLSFCDLLTQKDRLNLIPSIIALLQKALDEIKNVINVRIETPTEVSSSSQNHIVKTLQTQTPRTIIPEFAVNPELIAGFRATLNNTVIEGSIQDALSEFGIKLKS